MNHISICYFESTLISEKLYVRCDESGRPILLTDEGLDRARREITESSPQTVMGTLDPVYFEEANTLLRFHRYFGPG